MPRGIVTRVTRRYVDVCVEFGVIRRGQLASKIEVCVGDDAHFTETAGTLVVDEIAERKNCLRRSYGKRTKLIGANLDRLYVVTAPNPLFNNQMVDRVLAAAYQEDIPCTILVNKIDLKEDLESTRPLIDVYEALGVQVMELSAVTEHGLDVLEEKLEEESLSVVALAGISGVGKSSILNKIIPDVDIKTRTVSEKTGQGRQTTAQSNAFLHERKSTTPLYVIDLPGIQNYGITHLSKRELRHGFLEFRQLGENCRFSDCSHLNEPDCAVQAALEAGEVSRLRFESYEAMLKELESAAEW